MAEKKGKLLICDRCGATVFLECTGEGERDGGYTRWNNFEDRPEGWEFVRDCTKFSMLCPECFKKYKDIIRGFENG